ncbi:hypothetical protein ABZ372_40520, partial [Streptomyces sp. NPDC005921]
MRCAVPGPVARGVLLTAALPAALERGHAAAHLVGVALGGFRSRPWPSPSPGTACTCSYTRFTSAPAAAPP